MTHLDKIAWTPLNERFGAALDIDLNGDLSPSVVDELKRLFDERQLLCFRNHKIDYATQRKVVSIFGDLIPETADAKYVSTVHDIQGNPIEKPRDVDPRATAFHSDLIFMASVPVRGISLYAEDVSGENVEGTRFVSSRNGYLDLPESARSELEGRTAIQLHGLDLTVEEQLRLRDVPFSDEVAKQVSFWAEHPIFYPNPRTGEPVLFYVPWFTHSVVGMSPDESKKWFELFETVLYRDATIYTHRYQQDDLLVWDNLAIQHGKETLAANVGAVPPVRVLRRAIFGTEAPNIYDADYGFAETEEGASVKGTKSPVKLGAGTSK